MVETSYRVPVHHGDAWWGGLMDPLKGIGNKISDFFSPTAEASGNDQFYEIHVELPGVEEDDIEVTADNNVLLIKGERKFERKEEGKTYFFSERSYGQFQRSFRLPGDADTGKISATYKDGLLIIKVAKKEAGAQEGQRIPVDRG